jgi:hypothetical protein
MTMSRFPGHRALHLQLETLGPTELHHHKPGRHAEKKRDLMQLGASARVTPDQVQKHAMELWRRRPR